MNFMKIFGDDWEIQVISFGGDMAFVKILWGFQVFRNTGPYGTGKSRKQLLPSVLNSFQQKITFFLWGWMGH